MLHTAPVQEELLLVVQALQLVVELRPREGLKQKY